MRRGCPATGGFHVMFDDSAGVRAGSVTKPLYKKENIS